MSNFTDFRRLGGVAPTPQPPAALAAARDLRDYGSYEANRDAVASGWTLYLEHGGDRKVLDLFMSREAAHGNLAALSSMCSSVSTSIRAMPPEKRRQPATTAALESCLSQTELDGYRRASGIESLMATAAATAAAHEARALPAATKRFLLANSANPRRGEDLAMTLQTACNSHQTARVTATMLLSAYGLFGNFEESEIAIGLAELDASPSTKQQVKQLIQGTRCSVGELFGGSAGGLAEECSELELKMQACAALGYATIPTIKHLNAQHGIFQKPPNPETMLAPVVHRRHQGLLTSIQLLEAVESAKRVTGQALSDGSRELLRMLRTLSRHLLSGYEAELAATSCTLHAYLVEVKAKKAALTAAEAASSAKKAALTAAEASGAAKHSARLVAHCHAAQQQLEQRQAQQGQQLLQMHEQQARQAEAQEQRLSQALEQHQAQQAQQVQAERDRQAHALEQRLAQQAQQLQEERERQVQILDQQARAHQEQQAQKLEQLTQELRATQEESRTAQKEVKSMKRRLEAVEWEQEAKARRLQQHPVRNLCESPSALPAGRENLVFAAAGKPSPAPRFPRPAAPSPSPLGQHNTAEMMAAYHNFPTAPAPLAAAPAALAAAAAGECFGEVAAAAGGYVPAILQERWGLAADGNLPFPAFQPAAGLALQGMQQQQQQLGQEAAGDGLAWEVLGDTQGGEVTLHLFGGPGDARGW